MNWPWISRRAFDLVCDERDRLRDQVDKLQEHVRRMDRVDRGLYEVPREQRPKLEPIPPDIRNYINGWMFESYRREMRATVLKRHAAGESWADILESLRQKDGTPAIPESVEEAREETHEAQTD